jgi:pyruvate,water dikinase
MKFIKPFNQISEKDIKIAGGKGASLGEMTKAGIPVPSGFVVLANAFEKFLEETDINVEIKAMWDRINLKDMESVEENSEIVRDLIVKAEMPKIIEEEILKEYNKLSAISHKPFFVAVRSSATAEDSKIDAWAGQLESYLNITKENLIENIKKCWASLYLPRALFYRIQRKLTRKKVSVAVIVQKMINSEVSGVCFTVHPVTKDKNQIVIEAVWGLGEALVQGMVTPDTYVIEKFQIPKSKFQINSKSQIPEFKVLDINVNRQEKMIVRGKNGTKIVKVPKLKQDKQKLSKRQILELARLCQKIEKHYNSPQDIEWAIEKSKIYILQSRPITTL